MKLLIKEFLLGICLAIFFSGCATEKLDLLNSLQIGSNKSEVFSTLGTKHLQKRSATKDTNGNLQETYEYLVYKPGDYRQDFYGNVTYWLQFKNDKLVFYGLPGDYNSGGPSVDVNIKKEQ